MKITWTEVIEFTAYKGWLREVKEQDLPPKARCVINVTK